MANKKLTGTAILRLDGVSIRSKAGAKLMLGGFERTPQYADGVMVGYTEKPVHSQVDCTVMHDSQTDLDALSNVTSGTIRFECDSGPVYVISSVFSLKPAELTAGDGDVSVSYAGQPAVQQ